MREKLVNAVRRSETSSRLIALTLVLAIAFAFLAPRLHMGRPAFVTVWEIVLAILTALAFRRARFDFGTILVVLCGLWLYLAYFGYTDYGERNYDGGEQLRYIQYIVTNLKKPPASYCLICHHPPLYYWAGALVYAFCEKTKLTPPITGIMAFSLVTTMVFVGFGAATARLLAKTRRETRLATAFIVFWPYSVHNAVRLHNDTLVSLWMAAALYFLARWWKEERPRHLYLAALSTGLGLYTKSSAYALAGAIAMALALRFFRSRDKLRFVRRALVAAAILGGAFLLNARGKETEAAKNAPLCHKVLGNACDIGKHQWVENKPKDYLWLDLPTFLKEPYAIAEKDTSGRKYFWNHLLKSSLFGTHNTTPDRETSYEANRVLAYGMNGLLLGMLAYLVVGAAVFARRREMRRFGAHLACLVSCGAFMIGFRVLIPAPHHTDFRHVFAAVIPVSVLYAATAARARDTRMKRIAHALGVPFLGLSILYFVPKHDLAIRLTRRVVRHDLAEFARVIPEGTIWDHPGNLIIEENHIVEIAVPGAPTVSEVDVTFDNNDKYEIEIFGETRRRIAVGPKEGKGLTRYVQQVNPKVLGVTRVRVRPVSGDMAYSMGHLILR